MLVFVVIIIVNVKSIRGIREITKFNISWWGLRAECFSAVHPDLIWPGIVEIDSFLAKQLKLIYKFLLFSL